MGFYERLRNAVEVFKAGPVSESDQELLSWLGIDSKEPKALHETTYYTCLKVLSETLGKLPLKCYLEDGDGGRMHAPSDASTDRVLYRPNDYMTPATFWTTMEANCQHHGNAYAWIQRKLIREGHYGGRYEIVGLWPMRSDCVDVYMDNAGIFGNKGKLYYKYTDPKSGEILIFRSSDVLHIKTWLTFDGVLGLSVADILKCSLKGAGYSQQYLESLYEGGLTASSVLQYTGDLDDQLRKKLQKKYNDLLTGARNAGRVVALPVGMTLSPLTYKLTDAQYLELKQYTALQIAAAFGVKPNQVNDYTKSSYASSEAQQLAFLIDTMLYRLGQYEQEINYKLLSPKQREEGYVYKFNEKVLLRADSQTQMQTITSAIQNGVYTPNEGRHLLDLPSQDGGDQLIVNGNYIPLTSVGAAYGISEEGGNGE